MPVPASPDPIRALLMELRDDDYVRFKYGKRVEAALKALDATSALDARELEARLQALLELVRGGKKGGSPASPATKSRPRLKKEAADAAAD